MRWIASPSCARGLGLNDAGAAIRKAGQRPQNGPISKELLTDSIVMLWES